MTLTYAVCIAMDIKYLLTKTICILTCAIITGAQYLLTYRHKKHLELFDTINSKPDKDRIFNRCRIYLVITVLSTLSMLIVADIQVDGTLM